MLSLTVYFLDNEIYYRWHYDERAANGKNEQEYLVDAS